MLFKYELLSFSVVREPINYLHIDRANPLFCLFESRLISRSLIYQQRTVSAFRTKHVILFLEKKKKISNNIFFLGDQSEHSCRDQGRVFYPVASISFH